MVRRTRAKRRGLTLVEVITAVALLVVATLAFMEVFLSSLKLDHANKERLWVREALEAQMNQVLALGQTDGVIQFYGSTTSQNAQQYAQANLPVFHFVNGAGTNTTYQGGTTTPAFNGDINLNTTDTGGVNPTVNALSLQTDESVISLIPCGTKTSTYEGTAGAVTVATPMGPVSNGRFVMNVTVDDGGVLAANPGGPSGTNTGRGYLDGTGNHANVLIITVTAMWKPTTGQGDNNDVAWMQLTTNMADH